MSNWISDNGLILNAKKCESLLFRRPKAQRNQMNEEDISFSVNGTVIKPNISWKLLGVHIDDNLNFSKHVILLRKKTSKQIAIISRFKKLLSTKTKLLLYKAYILPHFTSCSSVWMHCGKTAAGKLEKLNERAMRCIFNDNISTFDELLVKANMPSLQNRGIPDMCIHVYIKLSMQLHQQLLVVSCH